MEEKKYEAGKVEISSAEYRDLIKEAVEARNDASQARSEKWKLESEKDKISKELELANKKIAELESLISGIQSQKAYTYITSTPTQNNPWLQHEVTCSSNSKEDN